MVEEFELYTWKCREQNVYLEISSNSDRDMQLSWSQRVIYIPRDYDNNESFKITYHGYDVIHRAHLSHDDFGRFVATVEYYGTFCNIPIDLWNSFLHHYATIKLAVKVENVLRDLPGDAYTKERVLGVAKLALYEDLIK